MFAFTLFMRFQVTQLNYIVIVLSFLNFRIFKTRPISHSGTDNIPTVSRTKRVFKEKSLNIINKVC